MLYEVITQFGETGSIMGKAIDLLYQGETPVGD